MPKSTAWERHTRRSDVIRLRYGNGMTVDEISEELGWSESTVTRDLEAIREETAKMGEPDVVREQVTTSLQHLLDHDFEDLHKADLAGDLEAKHRAKSSFRSTVQLIHEFYREFESTEPSPSPDAFFEELPAQAQDSILDVVDDEIEEYLHAP